MQCSPAENQSLFISFSFFKIYKNMNRVWGELLPWLRYTTTSSLAHATLHWWLPSHLLYSSFCFSSAFYSIGFPLDFSSSRGFRSSTRISPTQKNILFPNSCGRAAAPDGRFHFFFFSFPIASNTIFWRFFSFSFFSFLGRVFNGFGGAKAKIRPGPMLCARDDATLGRGLEPSKVDRHSDTLAPTQNDVQPLVLEP